MGCTFIHKIEKNQSLFLWFYIKFANSQIHSVYKTEIIASNDFAKMKIWIWKYETQNRIVTLIVGTIWLAISIFFCFKRHNIQCSTNEAINIYNVECWLFKTSMNNKHLNGRKMQSNKNFFSSIESNWNLLLNSRLMFIVCSNEEYVIIRNGSVHKQIVNHLVIINSAVKTKKKKKQSFSYNVRC